MGESRYVFQYRKGDFDGIKRDMGEFGAKFLSEEPFKRSVNDNLDLFYETLVNSMKKYLPQKNVSSRLAPVLKTIFHQCAISYTCS